MSNSTQTLGSMGTIGYHITHAKLKVVKVLHYICYATDCEPRKTRRAVRAFSGFDFDSESDEYVAKVQDVFDKFELPDLIAVCQVLGLNYTGDKNDVVCAICSFLINFYPPLEESDEDEEEDDPDSEDERRRFEEMRQEEKRREYEERRKEEKRRTDEERRREEESREEEERREYEERCEEEKRRKDGERRRKEEKRRKKEEERREYEERWEDEERRRYEEWRRMESRRAYEADRPQNDTRFMERNNDIEVSRSEHKESFALSFRDVEDSIRSFDGKDEYPIQTWIFEFEEVAEITGWNDLQKLIYAKKCLKGLAKLFVQAEKSVKS